MFFLSIISETLLYICFALLIATYIFSLVPNNRKPNLIVPTNVLLFAIAGIALSSFMPVLQLVLYLYEDYGLGSAFESVLLTFKVGNAWVYTFILSIILGLFITLTDGRKHKAYSLAGLTIVFLLVIGVALSSHASSISPIAGFAIHMMHFLAVTVWVGLLFVVSWFSKNTANWMNFLKWFHVTALSCFILTIISGLLLMNVTNEWNSYTDAWMVSYGQSLLIKHLLIIPLIGYALINGILLKKRLKQQSDFDPRPWTKIEFLVVLLIFAVTGAMSQQSPPTNLESLISYEGISSLFTLFYNGPVHPELGVELMWNGSSILFGVLAIIFLGISIASFSEKMSPAFSFIMSLFVVICGYLAFMQSVQVIN
ncbi:copper resistance D family protein [Oceanobacillus longus]|uniref:Copper resistance D family protein n=1 Tax=Oceanobacillus longus TaxID=930120 RepID=A0ABV8H0F5_9BACI